MKIIVLIIALAVVAVKFIDVTTPRAITPSRVDTLRMETTIHDSTTVISRAADTVQIRIKEIGPLTETDLVRIICAGAAESTENPRLKLQGSKADLFQFAPGGIVYCPEKQ